MAKAANVSETAWREGRRKWEYGEASVSQVADSLGISKGLVMKRKTAEGWVKGGNSADAGENVTGGAQSVTDRVTDSKVTESPSAIDPGGPPGLKTPVTDAEADRPRAVIVMPAGFDAVASRIAAEVQTGLPTRQKAVSGLADAFPDVERLPANRSTESLIRMQGRERMLTQLERRRQRLLALDVAFSKAVKAGDPKSAMAALNLAKAQGVLARLESELLLEHMEFAVNMVRAGRDPAAPVEPEVVPVVVDEAAREEVARRIRAEESGVPYQQQLPPGWK